MPPGPKPPTGKALTGAERQARYRARQAADASTPARQRRRPYPGATPIRQCSRPQRWHAAVGELVALQEEYGAWLDALPEATHDGATGEALQAIVDLDLTEILAIEPPRGFGRDRR